MCCWLFPFCYREHSVMKPVPHVHFSKMKYIKIIPNRYNAYYNKV